MTETVFVDTNLLIYAREAEDPVKQKRALLWMQELWAGQGRLSFQVLQEYFAKLVQKKPELREQARADVRDLLAWRPVTIDGPLLESAWKIQDRYRLSFWDALIVAAAKAARCQWLLTEDLQADQELDGIVVVNPFERMPEELLMR
ncbi:MAG TPA: PIN domain-containing protein [Acidobacteriaceae bacterium]|jgi:predicted nucleic acid-binding protein|nr:PIN domain-containing protein [Acidobacteriaceae bacterium]